MVVDFLEVLVEVDLMAMVPEVGDRRAADRIFLIMVRLVLLVPAVLARVTTAGALLARLVLPQAAVLPGVMLDLPVRLLEASMGQVVLLDKVAP